jgi:hypothetical protein
MAACGLGGTATLLMMVVEGLSIDEGRFTVRGWRLGEGLCKEEAQR